MEMQLVRLSNVPSRLGLSREIVDKLISHGILLAPMYAVEQVQAHAYRALLRQHITRPEPPDDINVDYRWGIEMRDWLCHNPEVEGFLEDFLGYLAAMSRSHSFQGFKRVVRIELEGRRCSLRPQARGLLLTVTRHGKPVRHVIESRADFASGLAWILASEDPGGRQKGRRR